MLKRLILQRASLLKSSMCSISRLRETPDLSGEQVSQIRGVSPMNGRRECGLKRLVGCFSGGGNGLVNGGGMGEWGRGVRGILIVMSVRQGLDRESPGCTAVEAKRVRAVRVRGRCSTGR